MSPPTARPALRRGPAVVVGMVLAVAALASLSGCLPAAPEPAPTVSGLATPRLVGPQNPLVIPAVIAYCPVEDAVHFTGYWRPTDEVYICRGDGRQDTDGVSSYGPWESAALIARPSALLAAYGAPDRQAHRLGCGNRIPDPLIIWVHRTGVTTAYYAPVDGCGAPTRAASDAYHAAARTVLIDVDRGAPSDRTSDGSAKDSSG